MFNIFKPIVNLILNLLTGFIFSFKLAFVKQFLWSERYEKVFKQYIITDVFLHVYRFVRNGCKS